MNRYFLTLPLVLFCCATVNCFAQSGGVSKSGQAEAQVVPQVESVPDRGKYRGVPTERFPEGFERSRLTPPAINSVADFLRFTEEIRAMPYEEFDDEKRIRIYFRQLVFAKRRTIVAAADDLLAKTKDPEDLFRIHIVKFTEFRGLRYSSPEERKAFNAYARSLSASPDKQIRSIPAAQELVMNTVYTAMLDATEKQHMTMVKMLFDHLDEYGVNEPAASASESIYRMYPAKKFPELYPVLIRGLAERFEKASAQTPDLREMNAKFQAEVVKLKD